MFINNIVKNIGQISGKPLSEIQEESIEAIIDSCAKHCVTNPKQIAYILATAYHEARLKPIEEIGKGTGRPYGSKLKQAKDKNGNHIPYTTPDQLYYGRGEVCQITWYENYETFGKLLNIDLLNHPELALDTHIGAEIGVIGMKLGSFTGVGLNKYFSDNISDPINARHIINGTDFASLIAGYYTHILPSLA